MEVTLDVMCHGADGIKLLIHAGQATTDALFSGETAGLVNIVTATVPEKQIRGLEWNRNLCNTE